MPHTGESIMTASYPEVHAELDDQEATTQMNALIDLIRSVRNIRSEANAPLSKPIDILINIQDTPLMAIFKQNQDFIERFVHPKSLEIAEGLTAPALAKTAIISGAEVYVPLAELLDLDEEITRLEGELKRLNGEIKRAQGKLANKGFTDRAPEKVVQEERDKQADYEQQYQSVEKRLAELKAAR